MSPLASIDMNVAAAWGLSFVTSWAVPVLVAAGLCLFAGPIAIRFLTRLGCIQPVRYDDCPPLSAYQRAKQPVPTLGGLLVLGCAAISAWIVGGMDQPEGWLIVLAMVSVGLVGLADDLLKLRRPQARGLAWLPKLAVTLAIGAVIGAWLGGLRSGSRLVSLPWTPTAVDLGWWWIPFAMVVMAGSAHAVNLTDGMDGLAVGCAAIAFTAIAVWSLPHADEAFIIIWCGSLVGACLGFLWFNSFPASIWLGDVGALGLGGALGILGLLTHAGLWLVVIGGVFVAETLSVILQVGSYKLRKQRVFRVAPIHHHFHLGGVSEHKLVVRFWIAGALLAALGVTAAL